MFSISNAKEQKQKIQYFKTKKPRKKHNSKPSIIFTSTRIENKPNCPNNSLSIYTNNTSNAGKGCFDSLKNELLSKKRLDFLENSQNKLLLANSLMKTIINKKDLKEGRWTFDEHIRFIDAIVAFGIKWKYVHRYIGTRTANQVRSHAQKFFRKLKRFKDTLLGIDFTVDNLKNLGDIIKKGKEYEKENNRSDFLISLLQKISKKKDEIVIFKDNKIIIKSSLLFEKSKDSNEANYDKNKDDNNDNKEDLENNITQNKIIDLKEDTERSKSGTKKIINKNRKVLKLKKIRKKETQQLAQILIKNENQNKMRDGKRDQKKEHKLHEITLLKEDLLFDGNSLDDFFDFKNLDDMKFDVNNSMTKFDSFSNFPNEPNTLNIMNKNYFC